MKPSDYGINKNALNKPEVETEKNMSFTMILLMIYSAFLTLDILAFKNKKWVIFIAITAVMIIVTFLLGYLWITSPN